jgi:hypothetical protein
MKIERMDVDAGEGDHQHEEEEEEALQQHEAGGNKPRKVVLFVFSFIFWKRQ